MSKVGIIEMDLKNIADVLINGIMNELEGALDMFNNRREEKAIRKLIKITRDLDDARIYLSRQNEREIKETVLEISE